MPIVPVALPAPRGMLLDFGGVIIETAKRPEGRDEVVAHLGDLLQRAGQPVDAEALRACLDAALVALKHWKHASSRRPRPLELSHREIVGDFLAADLPDRARAVLVGHAGEILEVMGSRLSEHHVRPGIPDLLQECAARGIPIGIVSNAHSGRHHRQVLTNHGLGHRFAAQVYSDEVGIRKPHPGMIRLAARALGVLPEHCWYVGDTQDRDVVAGRRAGVSAVLLTRTRHTDNPPFAVTQRADGVFDTPEGVLASLRTSSTPAAQAPSGRAAAEQVALERAPGGPPAALLLDHGGVVSTSRRNHGAAATLGAHLSALLAAGGYDLPVGEATGMVRDGLASYRATKHLLDGDGEVPQAGPEVLWAEHVGAGAPERVRSLLRAHAHDLMHRWYAVKAEHDLRPGIRDLLECCHRRGIPVLMVSNTVSGRGVRDHLAGHGLDRLISGYAFSDEVGRRKPDPALVRAALAMVDVPPADCWFLGDQARTDAVAAHRAGVGRRVLTHGGKGSREQLRQALEDGLATDLVDSPDQLVPLLAAALDERPTARVGAPDTSRQPIPTGQITTQQIQTQQTQTQQTPEHTVPDTQRTA